MADVRVNAMFETGRYPDGASRPDVGDPMLNDKTTASAYNPALVGEPGSSVSAYNYRDTAVTDSEGLYRLSVYAGEATQIVAVSRYVSDPNKVGDIYQGFLNYYPLGHLNHSDYSLPGASVAYTADARLPDLSVVPRTTSLVQANPTMRPAWRLNAHKKWVLEYSVSWYVADLRAGKLHDQESFGRLRLQSGWDGAGRRSIPEDTQVFGALDAYKNRCGYIHRDGKAYRPRALRVRGQFREITYAESFKIDFSACRS